MEINSQTALMDNDFLDHLTETQSTKEEIAEIVKKAFDGLRIYAAMHPLVYQKELMCTEKKAFLFSQQVIRAASFDDIFHGNEEIKRYYCILIPELFKKLTGSELEVEGLDVLTYWKRMLSLGEIHSMATCLICECGIFLSDDHDSKYLKKIIEEEFVATIAVYNRKEFVANLPQGVLTRSEKRSISHEVIHR